MKRERRYKELANYDYGFDDGRMLDQYYDDRLHDGMEDDYI
jgi:hypothetical protein